MIKNILGFILLFGTGVLFLGQTIASLENQMLLSLTILTTIIFLLGVYFHIKGLQN
ncbi:hypothetical protein [Anaerobranca gottschalkii]|uniref:Uncharacterized protein n=1 Tax=Anaerobranca gottschalkii DSM 13577 TaxID=1120990 RepID=A0A1I0BVZ2_9FIRM|nr:hypothetical protein [Anaerobranca gottschalkii]SET11245.1 hypothetical protein SAMN03080614_10504 [Anaerobranca gottschalkii DSM 13577]